MKAWHIAGILLGVTIVFVFIKNMRPAGTNNLSQGATGNDVIVGLSKFGSGLLEFGGKILAPSTNPAAGDPYKDIREEGIDDYVKRLDAGFGES